MPLDDLYNPNFDRRLFEEMPGRLTGGSESHTLVGFMKTAPDDLRCEICNSAATIQLRDTRQGVDHLYCTDHRPQLSPGKNPHLQIRRHRLPPDNACSKSLAAAEDSSDHHYFRVEMCELQLLGGEGACRYYLSKLTKIDQFALWQDEFVDNMREFVVRQTDGAAASFRFDSYTVDFMAPFLKHAYNSAQKGGTSKLTRQDRAVVLLLQHPAWSDEEIAENVPTTVKQLRRNTNYTVLRSLLERSNADS